MSSLLILVAGLVIGWLIELLIDYFYWRKRRICPAIEKELKSSVNHLEEQNTQFKRELDKQTGRVGEYETRLQDRKNELKLLTSELEERDAEIGDLRSELNSKENELAHLKSSLEDRNAEITALKQDLDGEGSKVDQLQSSLQAQEVTLNNLKSDVEGRDTEIGDLKTNLINKVGETEQLQAGSQEQKKTPHDLNPDLEVGKLDTGESSVPSSQNLGKKRFSIREKLSRIGLGVSNGISSVATIVKSKQQLSEAEQTQANHRKKTK